jgi:hypothetical protein
MFRKNLLAALACLIMLECAAAAEPPDAATLIVPGACYAYAAPKTQTSRKIDRIELQFMQVLSKDRQPIGGLRVQLGIQPKGGDDAIPSGLSAPCSVAGAKSSCRLQCDAADTSNRLGRFRVERIGKDRLRLVIETPLVLNGCPPEPKQLAMKGLVGQAFELRLAQSNNCFH